MSSLQTPFALHYHKNRYAPNLVAEEQRALERQNIENMSDRHARDPREERLLNFVGCLG